MTTLFFLHIPKCAGMSLTDALLERLPATDVYQSTSMIRNYRENRPEFLQIPKPRKLRAVVGHWVHEAMLPRLSKPIAFATSLRDPVSRIKSQYRFDMGIRGGNWDISEDPGKFLEQNRNVISTFLLRAFPTIARDFDDPVEGCKAILSSMDHVFDVSDADQRITQLLQIVGAGNNLAPRTNESSGVKASLDVSDTEISAYCEVDRAVYDWFVRHRALAPKQNNPVFDRERRNRLAYIANKRPYDPQVLVDYLAPKFAAEIHFGRSADDTPLEDVRAAGEFMLRTADQVERLQSK